MFLGMGLFSYSYLNDIKEMKGRHYRKNFESALPTLKQKMAERTSFAQRRIDAGDEQYLKFTHKKERAVVHHHWFYCLLKSNRKKKYEKCFSLVIELLNKQTSQITILLLYSLLCKYAFSI